MAASAIFDPPVGNTVVPVNTRSGLETAAVSRPNTRAAATIRLKY